MRSFFHQFYDRLSLDMIVEWASLNGLKLKPSFLTLEYYTKISNRIRELIEGYKRQDCEFVYFGFSNADNEAYDYCIIVDNHFYLNLFKFERHDYELVGPISAVAHAHMSLENFNSVSSSYWVKFLYTKFGDEFLRCYMFSKLRHFHVEEYIEKSHIIVDESVHIKELVITNDYKIYFFLDSQGYEFRIEINNLMECYIHRALLKISEYNHYSSNLPRYLDVKGDFTLYEFFKNDIMGGGSDCA